MLLPCFWQSRIQAGDLSSHIYNAWLAQLIQSGNAPGLVIEQKYTNVLTDWMLSALLPITGAPAAERITVSLAVLVFVWGAFSFISTLAGRPAWHMLPHIAILAYGWTFHMGFFNFYLSQGLCFFAMALLWKPDAKRQAGAAVLFLMAFVAHGLPVAWSIAVWGFRLLSMRFAPRRLTIAALATLLVSTFVLNSVTRTLRAPDQYMSAIAASQAWIYDEKYLLIAAGLLGAWVILFWRLIQESGAKPLLNSVSFHICLLTAAGIFILPTTIAIPGYQHNLAFIADRMALPLGICFCALLAAVRPPEWMNYALPALAVLFFGFLYWDDRILNRYEDRMRAALSPLGRQRVVLGFDDPSLRVNPFTHMIDRACLGTCYSYANYEPSTGQFRVRAMQQNPLVASTYVESWQMQTGQYVVQQKDLPIFRLELDAAGQMVTRPLASGMAVGMTAVSLLH